MAGTTTQNALRDLGNRIKTCHAILSELDDEALVRVRPEVSQWSIARQLYHTAEANGFFLQNATKLASGETPDVGGGPSMIGRVVLLTRYIPRGRGKSPVQPPETLTREAVGRAIAGSRAALAKTVPLADAIAACRLRSKHPALGNFTPEQWLVFAVIHTDHHLKIVADLRK